MPRAEQQLVEICSLGGGPGYDHIVLSVMAEFLDLCSGSGDTELVISDELQNLQDDRSPPNACMLSSHGLEPAKVLSSSMSAKKATIE